MKIAELLNPVGLTHYDERNSSRQEPESKPTCSICFATFSRKRDLHRHMRTVHTTMETMWFQCPNPGCDMKCTRVDALRSHLKSKKAVELRCQSIQVSNPDIRHPIMSTAIKRIDEKNLKGTLSFDKCR